MRPETFEKWFKVLTMAFIVALCISTNRLQDAHIKLMKTTLALQGAHIKLQEQVSQLYKHAAIQGDLNAEIMGTIRVIKTNTVLQGNINDHTGQVLDVIKEMLK